MPDNVLEITLKANLTALQSAMKQASEIVGQTVSQMKVSAEALPASLNAAAASAATALASFAPQIQVQGARVLDLKAAYEQLRESMRETEILVKEAGGAEEVGASIIRNYNETQVAAAITQRELNEALERYKILLNEAAAANARLAEASRLPVSVPVAATAASEVAPAATAGAAAGAVAVESASTLESATAAQEAITAAKEAETAAREENTAAVEAETAAKEANATADTADAEAEEALANRLYASNAARHAEIAATAEGQAALREHAAATAALITAQQELRGVENRSVEQEAALAAARERQSAAMRAIDAQESALIKAQNDATASSAKQAAATETISAARLRLASASVTAKVAQQDLSAAEELALTAGTGDAEAMNELAIAQHRVAVAGAELTAAQKAVAAETAEAGNAFSLFRQRLIIGENGIRAFVTTGLTSIPLLVAAIVGGFAVRAVNAMREFELEMDNLSRLTGESAAYLAQFGQAAEAAGAKSDDVTQVLRRLDRTVSDAASGVESARLTLRELGVDMTDINSGIVPKTSVVLAQMADYLHENAGNAEVMRAAVRSLGTDSVALAGFLAQGSAAVKEQADQFNEYGKAVQGGIDHAKSISKQLAEASADWKEFKILVMEAADEITIWGTKTLEVIGDEVIKPIETLIGLWDQYSLVSGRSLRNNIADMEAAAKKIPALQPPEPPQFALTKPGKESEGKTPASSMMGEWREELSNQEAAFDGSREAMLRMEVSFWQRIIDSGQAAGKDLIAVHTELSRTVIELRHEEASEALAQARDLAGLAASGSADRVALEQRAADVARARYGEDSREFSAAQESLLQAKRAQVEEEVRLNGQAADQEAEKYKDSSGKRVAIYDTELVSLKTYLTQANEASLQGSEAQRIIARGEADFIINQIQRVTAERARAATAAQEAQAAESASSIEKDAANKVRLIEVASKASEEAYKSEKSRIEDLQSKNLISQREKEKLLDRVAAAEFRTQMAAMLAERAQLQAAMAAVQAIQGQEAKYQELADKLKVLDMQIAESVVHRNQQIELSDQKSADNQFKLWNTAFDSMERAFKTSTDSMIAGTESFSRGMARIWLSIVAAMRDAVIQMTLEWARHEAAKLVISNQARAQQQAARVIAATQERAIEAAGTVTHATQQTAQAAATAAGQAAQTAAATTGSTQRAGVGIIETIKSIGQAAAQAAAHAFKWVMTEVPWPANAVLAPAAAAAAFAGVMVFKSLASAAGGMEVPHDMIAQVHKNEMVLPANISGGLKAMIAGGGTSNASVTNHNTFNLYHNGKDARQVMEDEMVPRINRAIRDGSLRLAHS